MKIDPSFVFKRGNRCWRQGRARGLQPLRWKHLAIRTDSLRKESIVGPVPQKISKICCLFLIAKQITAEDIEKRLNRGDGYGLEISLIYHSHGQENLVNWAVKKLEAVKSQLDCQESKCWK